MAVATLEGDAVVMMRKKLGKKPYDQAVLAVKHLKENFDEDSGKVLDQILAEHPGNPENAAKAAPSANGNGKVHRAPPAPVEFGGKVYATKDEVLVDLKAGVLDVDVASSMLDRLKRPASQLYCKVSEKGGISVYGLQRMPVTLYCGNGNPEDTDNPGQWERLAAFMPTIMEFIRDNYDNPTVAAARARKAEK